MNRRRHRFAQRRRAMGFSQESFAEQVSVDRSTVARWEAGDSQPQPWIRRGIATALNITLDQLQNLLADPDPTERDSSKVDDVSLGALLPVGPEEDGQQRLAWAAAAPGRADLATLDVLRRLLAELRHLEDVAGPHAAIAAVDAQRPLVEDLADETRGSIRIPALSMAGQWAQFRGWLALAVNDTSTATRMWDHAGAAAAEIGDPDLAAVVMSFRGHAAWLLHRPWTALTATQAALCDRRVCLDQQAYDWYQLARIHATTGDPTAARDALARGQDLAAAALADPAPRPPWHYYRTSAFWHLEAGLVWAAIGDSHRATASYDTGVATLPTEQRRAAWLEQYRSACQDPAS